MTIIVIYHLQGNPLASTGHLIMPGVSRRKRGTAMAESAHVGTVGVPLAAHTL